MLWERVQWGCYQSARQRRSVYPISKTSRTLLRSPLKISPRRWAGCGRLFWKLLQEGICSTLFTVQETIAFPCQFPDQTKLYKTVYHSANAVSSRKSCLQASSSALVTATVVPEWHICSHTQSWFCEDRWKGHADIGWCENWDQQGSEKLLDPECERLIQSGTTYSPVLCRVIAQVIETCLD